MCEDCGCREGNERVFSDKEHSHEHAHRHGDVVHTHAHPHEHAHEHAHDHTHEHVHEHSHAPRTVAVEMGVLERNDRQAAENHAWLAARGVVAVNLISSPGSGKTLLLEKTLDALRDKVSCAVITGDQQTDNDARRMMGRGAKVVQIETRSACHLNAEQVRDRLSEVVDEGVKLLFIENVGNLVCPAAFELGEDRRVVLLSVTEGEDKPLKYPVAFHSAGTVVLTKTDLLPHLDFNMDACRSAIRKVHPDARIIELSARTGQGMDAWLDWLRRLV